MSFLFPQNNKKVTRHFYSKSHGITSLNFTKTDHKKAESIALEASHSAPIMKIRVSNSMIINFNIKEEISDYSDDIAVDSITDSINDKETLPISEECGLDLDEPIYHINNTWK
mmetsp:Transcript_83840/g.102703  ORF Transcript_83840/g.102703 Transcript_83840/m.102703 type:complete len:113 (-) Transcript_83840:299-637(-)